MKPFSTPAMILCVALCSCSLLAAEGFDATKLPEGSSWEGTLVLKRGGKTSSTSNLLIRIKKRDGTKFEGEWIASDAANRVVYAIEGTIAANNRVSFTMVKRLVGKGPNDIVGNIKVSGQINADNTIAGTGFVPDSRRSISWNVKLAKD